MDYGEESPKSAVSEEDEKPSFESFKVRQLQLRSCLKKRPSIDVLQAHNIIKGTRAITFNRQEPGALQTSLKRKNG